MQQEPKHFESLYSEITREEELSQIVSYIREGNSCQLLGLPGVGRSSILGLLAYNKAIRLKHFPQNHAIVHFVMHNFSEVRGRPLVDVMKFLFLNLSNSLRARSDTQEEYEKVNAIFKEALGYQDELVMTQSLKQVIEYLALEKKLTIIFLFDRFDEYLPFVAPEFFTTLRSLRDKAKYRFSVVFSLARPLEDVVESQVLSDFSDFVTGHTITVRVQDQPTIDFRIGYLEKMKGKSLDKRVGNEIVRLTGGHIRLTKLAVETVLSSPEEISQLSSFLLSQKTAQSALENIWQAFTPSEQVCLVTGKEDKSSIDFFEKVGITEEGIVQIPLFSEFLMSKAEKMMQEEQSIEYDTETNTIKKGDIVLSDNLTKAEFRLLRHLLQYKNEVVEREDIVTTVWGENASTAGVTEQAIDQLIFRLRRKIETDPNNPLHLLTVKGRGVKFAP